MLRMLGRANDQDSIVNRVILSVGSAIVEGRLKPGDDVNSVELARTFETSRTPIREALLCLERDGLVEITARRRPRVARLRLAEVREIYQVREYLYGLVSRLVVEHATDDDLATLRGLQDRLAAAAETNDVDDYLWTNVEFRNAEAVTARNRQLMRILDDLGLRTLQLRHLSLSLPKRLGSSVADHAQLLRAYEERNAELAVAVTRALVRRGLAAIEGSGWTGSDEGVQNGPSRPASQSVDRSADPV
ncbi:MAG: FCD domain-containing protein [Streptosporangiales bacterium]|nr:FCD domain-containing protein [Streptosporangiales bacterium]